MTNEEKILSILEKMDTRLSKLETDVSSLKEGQAVMERDMTEVKQGQNILHIAHGKTDRNQAVMEQTLRRIDETVLLIEQEHGRKLDALFDGHKQLDAMVARIEDHVSAQDEDILKRVFPETLK